MYEHIMTKTQLKEPQLSHLETELHKQLKNFSHRRGEGTMSRPPRERPTMCNH